MRRSKVFGRSYAYANPERIGPGPYGRLQVVDVAMNAWQAGYMAAVRDERARAKRKVSPTQALYARRYRA